MGKIWFGDGLYENRKNRRLAQPDAAVVQVFPKHKKHTSSPTRDGPADFPLEGAVGSVFVVVFAAVVAVGL